jgi:hypothetical protein
MQAARHGERSHHRDNSSADVGFHEFKEVLDRPAHGKKPLNWPTGLGFGKFGAQILLLA